MKFRVIITKEFDVPDKEYPPVSDEDKLEIERNNLCNCSLDEYMQDADIKLEIIK